MADHLSSRASVRVMQLRHGLLGLGGVVLIAYLTVSQSDVWRGESRIAERAVFPLAVPPDELTLGTIWALPELPWKLHVRNISAHTVHVVQMRTSCSCLAVYPQSATIDPGENCEVSLLLDASDALSQLNDSESRDFRVDVTPVIQGYSGPITSWPLTGTARGLLRLSRSHVQFGDNLMHGQPLPVETVEITSRIPLDSLAVEYERELASVELTKLSRADYSLAIRPADDLQPGAFRFDVKLLAQFAPDRKAVAASISAAGKMLYPVEASPNSVHWGIVPIGRVLESRVVIHSPVKEPFRVDFVRPSSASIEVDDRKADQQRNDLFIRHRVTARGHQREVVTVGIESLDGAYFELRIPLEFHGVEESTHEGPLR